MQVRKFRCYEVSNHPQYSGGYGLCNGNKHLQVFTAKLDPLGSSKVVTAYSCNRMECVNATIIELHKLPCCVQSEWNITSVVPQGKILTCTVPDPDYFSARRLGVFGSYNTLPDNYFTRGTLLEIGGETIVKTRKPNFTVDYFKVRNVEGKAEIVGFDRASFYDQTILWLREIGISESGINQYMIEVPVEFHNHPAEWLCFCAKKLLKDGQSWSDMILGLNHIVVSLRISLANALRPKSESIAEMATFCKMTQLPIPLGCHKLKEYIIIGACVLIDELDPAQFSKLFASVRGAGPLFRNQINP